MIEIKRTCDKCKKVSMHNLDNEIIADNCRLIKADIMESPSALEMSRISIYYGDSTIRNLSICKDCKVNLLNWFGRK